MKVTRKSLFSGQENTMELDITEEQIARWKAGESVEDVMPKLTYDEREFMKTGCLPDEYDDMFGDGDSDFEQMYGSKVKDWDYD